MIGLSGQTDAVSVTFRANWAQATPENATDAPVYPLFPVTVTDHDIPPLLPREACAQCRHGQHDVIGFVVTYTHLSQNGVRFTDIAYVKGVLGHAQAQIMRNEAITRIQRGKVDATYAVIHTVYERGHRVS
jgi:hypothetical protein